MCGQLWKRPVARFDRSFDWSFEEIAIGRFIGRFCGLVVVLAVAQTASERLQNDQTFFFASTVSPSNDRDRRETTVHDLEFKKK